MKNLSVVLMMGLLLLACGMPQPQVSEDVNEQRFFTKCKTDADCNKNQCCLLHICVPKYFCKPKEPVAEPTPEEAFAEESFAEPQAEVVAEPQTEPVAEPQPEVVVEPQVEPIAEPQVEPAAEQTPDSGNEIVPEPEAEPTPEPVAEPQAEPAVEQTPDAGNEIIPETATETPAETTPEPVAEIQPEPPDECNMPKCVCEQDWALSCWINGQWVGTGTSWVKNPAGQPAGNCVNYNVNTWEQECPSTPQNQLHCKCESTACVDVYWHWGDASSTINQSTADAMKHCTNPGMVDGSRNKVWYNIVKGAPAPNPPLP